MKVHVVNKKLGETPLEALERFRKSRKIPKAAKLTYAGRLDPMASGVLLILEGASQAEKEKYLALPKVYEAEILFGFKTDTFDLLGLPVFCHPDRVSASERAEGSLSSLKGKIVLPIPAYSSVPLNGKPMFMHARAGKLKTSTLPKREMEIKSVKQLDSKQLTANTLLKYIQKNIPKVKGDFRQKEILKAWKKILCHPELVSGSKNGFRNKFGMTPAKYQIIKLKLSVSSGTYIRSIANYLGGTLFSLKRASVGKFKV